MYYNTRDSIFTDVLICHENFYNQLRVVAMMDIKKIRLFAVTLLSVSVICSCASTTGSSEGSSETFQNTSKASTDLTSSTSPSDDKASQSALLLQYTTINFSRLRADMAVGKGEYLESFAVLLQIDEPQRSAFYQLTRDHFSTLYSDADTTPEQLVANVERLLQAQPIS